MASVPPLFHLALGHVAQQLAAAVSAEDSMAYLTTKHPFLSQALPGGAFKPPMIPDSSALKAHHISDDPYMLSQRESGALLESVGNLPGGVLSAAQLRVCNMRPRKRTRA